MTTVQNGWDLLEDRLLPGGAVVPYLTAGYPTMERFVEALSRLAAVSEAVEIGIPFSDPMADGATIQDSSRIALEQGATLASIVGALESADRSPAPLVVMSYLNPLMAFGFSRLLPRLAAVGVSALVVPDLPHEEADELRSEANQTGIGLVELVTPVTAPDRLRLLGGASQGFTYAVTMTGTTGGRADLSDDTYDYLNLVMGVSRPPVLAGFGVRSADQVAALSGYCDGVIVGSALVEVLAADGDPVEFVKGLRP